MKVVLTQTLEITDIMLRAYYADYKQDMIMEDTPEDEIMTFEEWFEYEFLDSDFDITAEYLDIHRDESEYKVEIIR